MQICKLRKKNVFITTTLVGIHWRRQGERQAGFFAVEFETDRRRKFRNVVAQSAKQQPLVVEPGGGILRIGKGRVLQPRKSY
jgi:hypothetical protein